MQIKPLDSDAIADLGRLLATDKGSAGCWCMWFIIRVKDYHAAGDGGNEAGFRALAASSRYPMGVVGYEDGELIGWCAVGPRSRYARAVHHAHLQRAQSGRGRSSLVGPLPFSPPGRAQIWPQ